MKGSHFRSGWFLTLLAFTLAALVLPATSPAAKPPGLQRAMQVQDRNTARLMSLPDVVGTAIGLDAQGQPVVRVFTARAGVAGIPANLEGVSVEVEVTGVFLAIPSRPAEKKPSPEPGDDRTSYCESPVPIGVSVGNEYSYSTGTIGCRVIDTDGVAYALSNVHVFDPWHFGAYPGAADLAERIVQPGRIDDPTDVGEFATQEHLLGVVRASSQVLFDETTDETPANYVDAAIAVVPLPDTNPTGGPWIDPNTGEPLLPVPTRVLDNKTPEDGYGIPNSTTKAAYLGQPVQKYGRTTGLTKGQVSEINGTAWVVYPSGTALFEDQIIVSGSRFIKAGDSGSLLVTDDPDKNPVGLLFAGSGNRAIANHIDVVLDTFGVTIDGSPPSPE